MRRDYDPQRELLQVRELRVDERLQLKPMIKVEEISKDTLAALLSDFRSRGLGSDELSNGYIGVPLATLRRKNCSDNSACRVDFDLALKDLESAGLVDTGPVVPYDNPPNSRCVVIAIFSKREYAYLTEKGYKAAQRAQSATSATRRRPNVTISGGQFNHSQIGIGDQVIQSFSEALSHTTVFMDLSEAVEKSGLDSNDQARLLAAIEAMQKTHNTPTFIDRYKDFMALAANHMAIISPFVPALACLLAGAHA
jgi:hypothetical protein